MFLFTALVTSSCTKDKVETEEECYFSQHLNGWEIESFDSPLDIIGRDMYFPSENTGYIVGYDGLVLKTTDGASSWQQLSTGSTLNLLTVHFVNEKIGYVAGIGRTNSFGEENGIGAPFFKTTDGGNSWDRNYLMDFYFHDLYFFSEEKGIAIIGFSYENPSGHIKLATTENSGINWTILDLPIRPTYNKFYLASDKIVVGGKRILFVSTDSGNSWDSIQTPVEIYKSIRNLYPINDKIWLIDGITAIFKTTDGGKNWVEIDIPFTFFELIHFSSDKEGFAISSRYVSEGDEFSRFKGNIFYQTYDGGETWTQSDVFEECKLTGLSFFPTAKLGYSISGKVYRFQKK